MLDYNVGPQANSCLQAGDGSVDTANTHLAFR